MRLIDADAVEKITWQDPSYTDPINVLTEVREKVRALPTINAVPVIRCKDCHFYKSENLQCMMHEGDTEEWYDNDFCSLAERKDG